MRRGAAVHIPERGLQVEKPILEPRRWGALGAAVLARPSDKLGQAVGALQVREGCLEPSCHAPRSGRPVGRRSGSKPQPERLRVSAAPNGAYRIGRR